VKVGWKLLRDDLKEKSQQVEVLSETITKKTEEFAELNFN